MTDQFPAEGLALQRYSTRFSAAEINSSFHRPHRLSTWARWRDCVPDDFRFSVKLPKAITHMRKLVDCDDELAAFVEQVDILGGKLAVLLVQLPPKLELDVAAATAFFPRLCAMTKAAIACEPRHLSWFTPGADDLLRALGVARVAADPAICEAASRPGGRMELSYWRLHGSPAIYRSSYADRIEQLAGSLRLSDSEERWCIFDNTASSAATGDALNLRRALREMDQRD